MSSPQQPASQGAYPEKAAGPRPAAGPGPAAAAAAGKPTLYRSRVAPVIWWVWAAFAAANLADLAVQGRDHFAAEVAAVLLLITGVAYTAAFRPKIMADDAGMTITNPLRDHRVPWECVDGMALGDALELSCRWTDGRGQRTRTLYGWALQSPRRSRLRAQARARRQAASPQSVSPSYARLPQEVREAMSRTYAEHICSELQQRAVRARAAGAAGGAPSSRWNPLAVAAVLLPVLLLIAVILA